MDAVALFAFITGAVLAAGFAVVVHRRLVKADIGRAVADAEGRARAETAATRVEATQARGQVTALEGRLKMAETAVGERDAQLAHTREALATYRANEATFEARIAELRRVQEQAKDAFRAISADVFRSNSDSFLQLARGELEKMQDGSRLDLTERQVAIDGMLTPIRDVLAAYGSKLEEIEHERATSYGQLSEQLGHVADATQSLRSETASLEGALRNSSVRGMWGEVQLRRCCELAGMVERCDFLEQESVDTEDGRLRPDLVVQLPGGRTVVVDAKVPLTAYMEAAACQEEHRRSELLETYASALKHHVDDLSHKAYWKQFEHAPEFVVLFLPAESLFSAALAGDPGLIEDGVTNGVLIATPITLIALLKAVAYGWRQERITENAQRISDLGRELYDRLSTLGERFEKVGHHLGQSVDAYNGAVASLEGRVLVTARRFEDMGAGSGDTIGELSPVDIIPRRLHAPELVSPPGGSPKLTRA